MVKDMLVWQQYCSQPVMIDHYGYLAYPKIK